MLEPLVRAFSSVLESAFEKRAALNAPQGWLSKAADGDLWSVQFAKRDCWHILLGLDYLHSQLIAHRGIQQANICIALEYNLYSLDENEIQSAVGVLKMKKLQKGKTLKNQRRTGVMRSKTQVLKTKIPRTRTQILTVAKKNGKGNLKKERRSRGTNGKRLRQVICSPSRTLLSGINQTSLTRGTTSNCCSEEMASH